MSILVKKSRKVILHGMSSIIGRTIFENYQNYAINLVGGICYGKGGGWSSDGKIPIFDSIRTASIAVNPDICLISVSANECYDAFLDSIHEEIPLIICLSKNIPQIDLIKINEITKDSEVNILGPNTFGIYSPGEFNIGVFPGLGIRKGNVGLISTASSIAYEVALHLREHGDGISTAVDLGNVNGFGMKLIDLVKRFEQDPETEKIVILANSKFILNIETIKYLTDQISKPVILYQPGNRIPAQKMDECAGKLERKFSQRCKENREMIKNSGIATADNIFKILDFIK